MTHEFKPGDVALLTFNDGSTAVGVRREADTWGHCGGFGNGSAYDLIGGFTARPLVVIDPESREQVERLAAARATIVASRSGDEYLRWDNRSIAAQVKVVDELSEALRQFVIPTPTKPAEPTDPKARVTDSRDNIWRLLADGDWICADGPDTGEYVVWWQLAERGPLSLLGDQS